MPIDKKDLIAYIDELGFSDAVKANLLQELEADEKRAAAFVGQRMRQADYTKKTTELAEQRKALEGQTQNIVSQAVKEYAVKLQEADAKVTKILKDLEGERISRATAEERLQRVKTQYELSDDDIPAPKPAGDPQPKQTIDIDAKLEEFGKNFKTTFIKEIMPELMSFPQISAIQSDIQAEHMDLTGKRLSSKEMKELVDKATKEKVTLFKAWEDQYGIGDIRMKKHDEEITGKARQKWEEEQKDKASKAALAGVSNADQGGKPISTSPVLREYQDRSKDSPGSDANGNGNHENGNGGGPKLSGAERAAVRWTERRNQGIPLGKEAPAK